MKITSRSMYRYRRWIALCIGAICAALLYCTASDPAFSEPCHGFAPGDPERMVLSWQVDHPISAGFISALTFGVWPRDGIYAVPGACTYRDYGVGLPMYYYNLIRAKAYPTWLWTRTIVGFLFTGWLSLLLLRAFFRPLPSRVVP